MNPFYKGLIGGFIGLIIINLAEFVMTKIQISSSALWEVGGLVFLSKEAVNTPIGMVIGVVSHVLVGLFLGITISYFLYYTGRDLWLFKGTAISLGMLFIILGVYFPFREINLGIQNNPKDVVSAFIDHLLFGISASYVIFYLSRRKVQMGNGHSAKK